MEANGAFGSFADILPRHCLSSASGAPNAASIGVPFYCARPDNKRADRLRSLRPLHLADAMGQRGIEIE
jgi:hypothetical protein